MIEIVKEGENRGSKRELPQNVRQIGEVRGKNKIYIEDYIMTFMRQSAAIDETPKALVLYGRREKEGGSTSFFVNGAILASCSGPGDEGKTVFKEETWREVNEKAEHFFKDSAVLGWMYLRYDLADFVRPVIVNTHKQFFREEQQLYFEYSVAERCEKLYLFERGSMRLQTGYYIYYEKNEAMQNYMITVKQDESEEAGEEVDRAAKKFRGIVQEKKEEIHRKQTVGMLYGTSVAMLLIVTIIGITMLNNYEKMQNMEKVLYDISESVAGEDGQAKNVAEELAKLTAEVIAEDAQVIDATQKEEPQGGGNDAAVSANMVQAVPVLAAGADAIEGEMIKSPEEAKAQEAEALAKDAKGAPEEENGDAGPAASAEDGRDISADAEENRDPVIKAQEGIDVPGIYCIEKGDTLVGICMKFYGNTSMLDAICEANNIIDRDNIHYGDNIVLP